MGWVRSYSFDWWSVQRIEKKGSYPPIFSLASWWSSAHGDLARINEYIKRNPAPSSNKGCFNFNCICNINVLYLNINQPKSLKRCMQSILPSIWVIQDWGLVTSGCHPFIMAASRQAQGPSSKLPAAGCVLTALQGAPKAPLQSQSQLGAHQKSGKIPVLGGGLFSFPRTSVGEITTLEHK